MMNSDNILFVVYENEHKNCRDKLLMKDFNTSFKEK